MWVVVFITRRVPSHLATVSCGQAEKWEGKGQVGEKYRRAFTDRPCPQNCDLLAWSHSSPCAGMHCSITAHLV